MSALALYDNNEFDGALGEFEKIADTSKILFNMGVIHATLGEHEKAVSDAHFVSTLSSRRDLITDGASSCRLSAINGAFNSISILPSHTFSKAYQTFFSATSRRRWPTSMIPCCTSAATP